MDLDFGGNMSEDGQVGVPVSMVGDVVEGGVPVLPVKKKVGRPKGSADERLAFKEAMRIKGVGVQKFHVTAGESFEWVVERLGLSKTKLSAMSAQDAPDADAWLLLNAAIRDEDFMQLFRAKVLERKMKKMEQEQKRQFLDDGRVMDGRLAELEGLLKGDELLPKG